MYTLSKLQISFKVKDCPSSFVSLPQRNRQLLPLLLGVLPISSHSLPLAPGRQEPEVSIRAGVCSETGTGWPGIQVTLHWCPQVRADVCDRILWELQRNLL